MKILSFVCSVALVSTVSITAGPRQTVKTIEGMIVRAEDGSPIAGARVILDRSPVTRSGSWQDQERSDRSRLASDPTIITDPSGRFFFNAAVGDWPDYVELVVRANGFVPENFSIGSDVKPGKGFTIKLERAGAITGHVKDRSGQAIPNMPVRLISRDYESYGVAESMIVDTALTNDRGEYRIYGIDPGRYQLLAGNGLPAYLAGASPFPRNPFGNIDSFGHSFYPGVATIDEASTVVIKPGTELQALDFAMSPHALHRIRGRILDSRTGKPAASPNITIVEGRTVVGNEITDEYLLRIGSGSTYDSTSGLFDVHDLAPGVYTITVEVIDRRADGAPRDDEPARASASITVTVSDADVNDVVIALLPHRSLTGQIHVEGEGRESIRPDRFSVKLLPLLPRDAHCCPDEYGGNYANADGTFVVGNVPQGNYRVVVNNGFQQDAYVRSIRFNGMDIPNARLSLAGTSFGVLDVTLSPAAGKLSGACFDGRGKPAAEAQTVLVPERNREDSDLFKTAKTGKDGRFAIPKIAPGTYRVYCWEDVEYNAWFDPSFLAQGESKARLVSIRDRGEESIDLQIIPK